MVFAPIGRKEEWMDRGLKKIRSKLRKAFTGKETIEGIINLLDISKGKTFN
jgi:hypothetical protein